jgi:hypothetical protein
MELMDHQLEAIDHLGSGKILYGNVGSGKSAAVLGYYMKKEIPKDIYVITTAKKRDSLDWEGEAAGFGISTERSKSIGGAITIDSWNNINKYTDIRDAFFIFDEQRVVGHGVWVKSFIKIARRNHWVLLSATPGDTWMDYVPVFIANGFYKNRTAFKLEHVVYEPFKKYPKIKMYLGERKLEMLRNDILVEMPYIVEAKRILNYIDVAHDREALKRVYKERWNIYEDRPIKDMREVFWLMRRIVNSDPSRLEHVKWLMKFHPKIIVFYNFNYELEILRSLGEIVDLAEWNGHKKQDIPDSENWVYLVQYISGAEGWNCTLTDCMILYSMTYSYKNFVQAQGRIDRLNSGFEKLFYYVFVSNSMIDKIVLEALKEKRSFNERKFIRELSMDSDKTLSFL